MAYDYYLTPPIASAKLAVVLDFITRLVPAIKELDMGAKRTTKPTELGPFWLHMIEVTRGELIHLETGQPYPALQIVLGGESMSSGEFLFTVGLSAELAQSFLSQINANLLATPIVQ